MTTPRKPASAVEEWLSLIYEQRRHPIPTGTVDITENGTYDVAQYASAEVAVPGSTPTGSISITQNGTVDVAQYAEADVNVWTGFDYRGLSGVKFMSNTDSSIDVSTLDTSGFTTMESMFQICRSVTSLDVSGFNTSSVTTIQYMFYKCTSLTSLDLANFDTSSVQTMYGMFGGSTALVSLNLQSFTTVNTTRMTEMIQGCTNLTDVIWAIDSTTVQPLVTAKGFDKVADTVPSDLNIWVRDSLLTQYQQETNWSRYSACFKPISQLPAALQTLYNIDPNDYQ